MNVLSLAGFRATLVDPRPNSGYLREFQRKRLRRSGVKHFAVRRMLFGVGTPDGDATDAALLLDANFVVGGETVFFFFFEKFFYIFSSVSSPPSPLSILLVFICVPAPLCSLDFARRHFEEIGSLRWLFLFRWWYVEQRFYKRNKRRRLHLYNQSERRRLLTVIVGAHA